MKAASTAGSGAARPLPRSRKTVVVWRRHVRGRRAAVPDRRAAPVLPASDRPELVVDLQLSQNASFAQTRPSPRAWKSCWRPTSVLSVTSYVGGGSPRFYLPLNVQTPDITLAELVLQTKDEEAREAVIAHCRTCSPRISQRRAGGQQSGKWPIGRPARAISRRDRPGADIPVADKLEALIRRTAIRAT
jgi:multidrug efflux pump